MRNTKYLKIETCLRTPVQNNSILQNDLVSPTYKLSNKTNHACLCLQCLQIEVASKPGIVPNIMVIAALKTGIDC